MTSDLTHLLNEALPEPPRQLLADVVLRAARHRRRSRMSLTAALITGVVATAVTGWQAVQPGNRRINAPSTAAAPTISVLTHSTALKGTAASFMKKMLTDQHIDQPLRASLVATLGPRKLYLFATRSGLLCTLMDEGYGSASGGCGNRSDLITTGVISGFVPSVPDGSLPSHHYPKGTLITIVVPDGYRTATFGGRTVTVVNNVALLAGPFTARQVTIAGPSVRPATFNLDF